MVPGLRGASWRRSWRRWTASSSRRVYEALDKNAIDNLVTQLRHHPTLPDVITLYLSGTDLYAHVAKEGPDEARRKYLVEVVDPARRRRSSHELRRRHHPRRPLDPSSPRITATRRSSTTTSTLIGTTATAIRPASCGARAFACRPFRREESPVRTILFTAVLAYGGALGFVYLADRS